MAGSPRPADVKPPAHWGPSPPVPEPELVPPPSAEEDPHNSTRYGDWEKNGIAIDF